MDKHTKALLGLQAYQVLMTQRHREEEEIMVALPASSPCPRCWAPTSTVHQESRQPSRVLWGFLNGAADRVGVVEAAASALYARLWQEAGGRRRWHR